MGCRQFHVNISSQEGKESTSIYLKPCGMVLQIPGLERPSIKSVSNTETGLGCCFFSQTLSNNTDGLEAWLSEGTHGDKMGLSAAET